MQQCNYVYDKHNLYNLIYKIDYILHQEEKEFSIEDMFNIEDNNDIEIEWLVKNIQAHFYKLINIVLNLLEFQKINQEGKIKLNIDMKMTIINSLEYFFIKKSTILELLDIFYKLFFNVNKDKKQLEKIISKEMKQFLSSKADSFFEIKKYHKNEIMKVRNRIIHNQGYSIKSFIDNDIFLFQVYDFNLDEQIEIDLLYSYYRKDEWSHKPPLIVANDYLVFQLCSLYVYVDIYFDFLLSKKESILGETKLNDFEQQFIDSSKYIMYLDNDLSLLKEAFEKLDKKINNLAGNI